MKGPALAAWSNYVLPDTDIPSSPSSCRPQLSLGGGLGQEKTTHRQETLQELEGLVIYAYSVTLGNSSSSSIASKVEKSPTVSSGPIRDSLLSSPPRGLFTQRAVREDRLGGSFRSPTPREGMKEEELIYSADR